MIVKELHYFDEYTCLGVIRHDSRGYKFFSRVSWRKDGKWRESEGLALPLWAMKGLKRGELKLVDVSPSTAE